MFESTNDRKLCFADHEIVIAVLGLHNRIRRFMEFILEIVCPRSKHELKGTLAESCVLPSLSLVKPNSNLRRRL